MWNLLFAALRTIQIQVLNPARSNTEYGTGLCIYVLSGKFLAVWKVFAHREDSSVSNTATLFVSRSDWLGSVKGS